jgi:hypothetical protein
MSSPELVMIEAACFQLRSALAEIADEAYATPLRIALNVLVANVAAAKDSVNASTVSDIEFALNDVLASADELPASDAERIATPLQMLRADLASLQKLTALPDDLVKAIHELQAKLRMRRDAIEMQNMREDIGDLTLPHPPDALKPEAVPIRTRLRESGFAHTPTLDVLIEHPAEFLFHSINELLDELDVIIGA